ncbi:MAG: FMN-binding protein [Ruminiclostridium sp.]|nr:FMN-binding protein [Ruminiclostridium sp.]
MTAKPAIVLSCVTTIISALLIVAHNLTYVDTSGIITEKLMQKCVSLMGEGEYSIVSDWKQSGYAIDRPDSVSKLILKDDGTLAFEIVANGYNKGGLDLLIAMNSDGSVAGIEVVSMTETPGLGTNVNDPDFLARFAGISDSAVIVKKTPTVSGEVEAVTGATYSSKGVAAAVNTAVSVYAELGVSV